jgi:hypothetical protein
MEKLAYSLKIVKKVIVALWFALKYIYRHAVIALKWLREKVPTEKPAISLPKGKISFVAARGGLVKVWKSLRDLPDMTVIYTVLGSWGLSYLIFLGLNQDLSHGEVVSVAHPAVDVMIPAVASLSHLAWPIALLVAIGLPIFLLYVDVKYNKKDDFE